MTFSLRDPVHDYIRVDALEARILQTRPLQRLRSVRQLGLANLVFPSAEHSRFSHVLGAMELAGRLYDVLAARSEGLLEKDLRCPQRRCVRLAALMHDIGHAPFSHSAEELFEDGIDHERMTRRLLALPEIAGPLDAAGEGIGVEPVARILNGTGDTTERLLSQIVSGEMDVDKMDYLLRDSHFCGVRYGNYDLGRLLETLVPLRDPQTAEWGIGVEEGGVHAFEALVLARYYMFTQVYFNVTGKVLELHLNEWLNENGVRWPSDPDRFLEHDDLTVWSEMRRSAHPHARAILDRDHYLLAFETHEHLSHDERRRFTTLLEQLVAELDPHDVLVSNAAKDPHRLSDVRVWVRDEDGHLEPMERASHFIAHLSRIDRFRVYVPRDERDQVRGWFGERWERG